MNSSLEKAIDENVTTLAVLASGATGGFGIGAAITNTVRNGAANPLTLEFISGALLATAVCAAMAIQDKQKAITLGFFGACVGLSTAFVSDIAIALLPKPEFHTPHHFFTYCNFGSEKTPLCLATREDGTLIATLTTKPQGATPA